MEIKGMMDKIGFPCRDHFIGRKGIEIIEPNPQTKNTVSIVPIIGEYRSLSGIGTPGLKIYKEETRPGLYKIGRCYEKRQLIFSI